MKKIVSIVGARPQFIKMVPLSNAISKTDISEIVLHTGQHYDYEMSQIFFEEMRLKPPEYHLGIGSSTHGAQTGRMLEKIEEVLIKEKPNGVVVYGDTNSTLAGALAASKLHIPVFHIEAGLRSFNKKMPEEINRVLTDHLSSLLFAPTEVAVNNLRKEGIKKGVFLVGDIMFDTYLMFKDKYLFHSKVVLQKFSLKEKEYGIVTIHREENAEDKERFESILEGLKKVIKHGIKLIFPAHPRVRNRVPSDIEGLMVIKPLSYIEMQALLSQAFVVFTDSGGLQKEAYFHKVPCITLRDETEWLELEKIKVNFLTGTKRENIIKAFEYVMKKKVKFKDNIYGDGNTSLKIAELIKKFLEGEIK